MGSMMKNDSDLLTLQVKGDGPLMGMTVTADARGTVKGYVEQPLVLIPARSDGKLDVGSAVGKGTMYVIKDLGLKDPYVGQIELQTGEIAEDLAYYYMASEQVPSAVALGVLMDTDNTVKQAGGVIIQLMPDATEEIISILEGQVTLLYSVTDLLEEGLSPEELLELVMGPLGDFEILDRMDTEFKCNCSKERVRMAVASISEDDIREIIADGKNTEIVCHFCNTAYNFSVEDMEEILKEKLEAGSDDSEEEQ